MRSATLFAALVLSFSVLSLSTPANASPAERSWTFDLFAPSASAKKSVVAKRAGVKQAAQKRTVEYYPVETSRADYATEIQQKRIAKHSRKAVDATRSTQNNFSTIWQAWTVPAAYPQPRAQTRGRTARVAYGSVPNMPFLMPYHRADLSAEYPIQQYAPLPAPTPRRPTQSASRGGMPALFASSDIVSEARRWIGTNPTNMNRLWCARFMNFVLKRSGFSGTDSDAASSFASYGQRVYGPQIGAIAVMRRGRNGGHVGVVSGIDPSGNPIVISGNHGRRVGEGVYSRSRIYAYVRPI